MNSNLNSVYPLSYSTFLNDIQRFKKAGGPNTDLFNFFDSPSHKYYKIFFYFGTKSENNAYNVSSEYSGLLAPTWLYADKHFEELYKSKYYINKYVVKEPKPAIEPWNIGVYNDKINSVNAVKDNIINKNFDNLKTDYDYVKEILDKSGIDISKIKDLPSKYTGNLTVSYGLDEYSFAVLTFENGVLKNKENTSDPYQQLFEYALKNDLKGPMAEREKLKDDLNEQLNANRKAHDYFVNDKINYKNTYDKYINDLSDYQALSLRSKFVANPAYLFNTAWAYLCLQGYGNKALQLKNFIELLSNISIESPWYFSSVTGISEALNRKCADGAKMDLSMRSKITIKCLPDAFDNRIGTLLDLYRSVVFDWNNKREIIPANLRKFDMAIYVFEAPDQRWHKEERGDLTKIADKWTEAYNDSVGNTLKSIFPNAINDNEQSNYNNGSASLIAEDGNSNFLTSHKLIEFHDCEINYNTGTSAWSALDNKAGFTPQYDIEISFGDCYEISYNDLFQQYYGDSSIIINSNSEFYNNQRELLNKRIEKNTDSWTKRLGIGLLNRLNDKGLSFVKNLAFGNLYGFSLTDKLNQISNGIQNPMMAFDTVKNYVKNGKNDKNRNINRVKRRELGSDSNIVDNNIITNNARNELNSDNNISDNNIITNNARNELNSDSNIVDNNIITNNARNELNSDNNIVDNNIIGVESGVRYLRGNIFSNYTKNKVLKSEKTESIGNIFKASTVANNL